VPHCSTRFSIEGILKISFEPEGAPPSYTFRVSREHHTFEILVASSLRDARQAARWPMNGSTQKIGAPLALIEFKNTIPTRL
jgi:hypothetical protein